MRVWLQRRELVKVLCPREVFMLGGNGRSVTLHAFGSPGLRHVVRAGSRHYSGVTSS